MAGQPPGDARGSLVKQAGRWLLANLPLMLMALLLATLAWVVALEQADPTIDRAFAQPIPVSPTGVGEDLLIVGSFEERVQVTLQTTQSVWETLEVEDFEATVDLSGLGPGTHEVPVEVTLDREPASILNVQPEMVEVQLDAAASRIVPVEVEARGDPAVGYVVRQQILDPTDVTVQGPSSYVTRVVEGFAVISIDGADGNVEETVTLRPRDADGDSVPFVSLNPDAADVFISIEPSGYHSTLAVQVVLTGEVASGYRVTDISIDPPTVTVFGDPADLAALEEGFIETKPINVAGAQQDIVVRPGLTVPPLVTVVPGQQVEVRVSVEAIESSLTINSTPEVQGLEPGFTATLSPEVVQVVLNGPLPRLEALTQDDVRVVLDLFGLPPGTHQIEPEVIAPEEISAQSVIPATIQVRISDTPMATITPTSTVTASLTSTVTGTITPTRTVTP